MITAVVLTKNEERNIKACLESLQWCDEILVIDDYSEDQTLKKIQKFKGPKLRIFRRHLEGDFAAQRNFGLEKAKDGWILFVDADERVPSLLKREIEAKIKKLVASRTGRRKVTPKQAIAGFGVRKGGPVGFYLKRCDFVFGRWLKHGEPGAVKLLRLAQKRKGRWQGKVHETWKVEGKTATLKNPLLHYPHQNLTAFLKKINYFSSLAAQEAYGQGKRVTFGEWLKPPVKFFQNYFLRLGFLDGTAGFVHALLMSFHSFLVRAKLFMLWKKHGGWR